MCSSEDWHAKRPNAGKRKNTPLAALRGFDITHLAARAASLQIEGAIV